MKHFRSTPRCKNFSGIFLVDWIFVDCCGRMIRSGYIAQFIVVTLWICVYQARSELHVEYIHPWYLEKLAFKMILWALVGTLVVVVLCVLFS